MSNPTYGREGTRSKWEYDHSGTQRHNEHEAQQAPLFTRFRFSPQVWRRIFVHTDTLRVTSDIESDTTTRVQWETKHQQSLTEQERLKAAILRTQQHLPVDPIEIGRSTGVTEGADRTTLDDQPEINQIMQDDMRQAAIDAQVVKETLQKQYEEKLKGGFDQ